MSDKSFSHLVGVPYKKLDCWELAKQFYQDVLGVELKHYYDDVPRVMPNDAQALIYSNMGDFEKIEKPEFGSLILIRIKGIECHIGVYLGNGQMLHSDVYNGSTIERLQRWRSVVSGYYRLRIANDKN